MNQGAYVYQDIEDKDICLFMFKKLTDDQMDVALPVNRSDTNEGDYFIAILKKGKDYLGKTLWTGIDQLMSEQPMYDLMSLSYEEIQGHINNLSKEEYIKYKNYVLKKMEMFVQIQTAVSS